MWTKLCTLIFFTEYKMAIVNNILFGVVCFIFMMAGGAKLYGVQEMKEKFAVYSGIFPLAKFGFIPDPVVYRLTIGLLEVLGTLILLLGPAGLKQIVYLLFIVLMIGASYTHFIMGEIGPAAVPAIICAILVYLYIESGKVHGKTD